MKKNQKHLWFAAKRYGYGWYPVTWEGWIVTLAYVVLLLLPMSLLPLMGYEDIGDALFAFAFLPYVIILTALLLWICVKKGEKARWRWGK